MQHSIQHIYLSTLGPPEGLGTSVAGGEGMSSRLVLLPRPHGLSLQLAGGEGTTQAQHGGGDCGVTHK